MVFHFHCFRPNNKHLAFLESVKCVDVLTQLMSIIIVAMKHSQIKVNMSFTALITPGEVAYY